MKKPSLKEKYNKAVELLKTAVCRFCNNSGMVVTKVNPDGSIDKSKPCQWCYDRSKLIQNK